MGLFSGILGTLGGLIPGLGPIGGAIGSAVGGLFDSEEAEEGVRDQNNANAQQAAIARQFNAEQAELNRSFQSKETGISRDFNSAEAAKSREWSERMSGSSYQRAMEDMAKAGLNPMLAVSQGGAATPGAASASAGAPSGSSASGVAARMENSKAAGLEQSIALKRLANETNVSESQAAVNRASAEKIAAETVNVPTTGANIAASTTKMQNEVREIDERIGLIAEQTRNEYHRGLLLKAQEALARTEENVKYGQLDVQEATIALDKARTLVENMTLAHKRLDLDRAKAESKFYGSDVGESSAMVKFIAELLRTLSIVNRR